MTKRKTPEIPVTYAPGAEPTKPTIDIAQTVAAESMDDRIAAAVAKALAARDAQAPKASKATEAPSSEDFESKVARAVTTAMAAAMPEMAKAMGMATMAVESAKAQTAHDKLLAENKKKLALEEKCSICRQVVGDGKTRGCGGPWARDPKGNFIMEAVTNPDGSEVIDPVTDKPMMRRIEKPEQFHVKMVVYPKDPLAAEWFPYLKINGVEYFSQGSNHEIWVPAKNDFASALALYEENERIQRVGRKHVRKNGGSVHNPAPLGAGFTS